jgi:pyruvate formate lyase activating enzyme
VKFSVKGFEKMSLNDWDGMVVSTLYLGGCNFRCPYCHNSELVLFPDDFATLDVSEALSYVTQHNDFLDGVVISGGEPCTHRDLSDLAELCRGTGVRVKLDTNGSNPDLIESLIRRDLVDYVAMDIKAPLDFESYSRSAGITDPRLVERVRDCVDLLLDGKVDYEFRTTVVPALHRASDLERIADQIRGARRFAIQNFKARTPIDPQYLDETPYNSERLEEFQKMAAACVEECLLRGV